MENKRIAVVRICGKIGVKKEIKDTLKMLRLYNKYTCIVVPSSKNYLGMIMKINNYVTWGEIDNNTFKLLLEKRGKITKKEKLTNEYIENKTKLDFNKFAEEYMSFKKELKDIPGLKNFFKLSPPRGGFETKGTKMPFSLGGVLGYRKEKINELLMRMI
ncbi:50S ribosomal protein L30 [Candidatus Woesearchaeota archaeon]|nr:50S ribosomal protein L30 [Candidatus Woesearchaeota archaeon]